jgi:hypothetical protein
MSYPPDITDEKSPLEIVEDQRDALDPEEDDSPEDIPAENQLEIKMQQYTTFELPLQKVKGFYSGIPLPSFNLSLKEFTKYGGWRFANKEIEERFNENEEFDYLEIELTIGGDDPRIKLLDIYTQYAGMRTLLIKHSPKNVYPLGMAFYNYYDDWDDLPDRTLEVGEVPPTIFKSPASYAGATGFKAISSPLIGSENGEITVGMCRGNELNSEEKNFYGKPGEKIILFLDLGHTLEFDPKNMKSGCAINSKNPLTSYTYIWRDYHPIPFSVYMVWGYVNDTLGRKTSNPLVHPYGFCFALYTTEWLKAGEIISRTGGGPSSLYNYVVRCVSGINGTTFLFENISVPGILMKYEIGRWVILSKTKGGPWEIIPSSGYYWEQAVDYLRR